MYVVNLPIMFTVLLNKYVHSMTIYYVIFFFKQKTAYEMRISDWSSDVCSSDLVTWTIESSPPSDSPILAWARTGLAPALRPMPPHTALPPRNPARLAPRRPTRTNPGLAPQCTGAISHPLDSTTAEVPHTPTPSGGIHSPTSGPTRSVQARKPRATRTAQP